MGSRRGGWIYLPQNGKSEAIVIKVPKPLLQQLDNTCKQYFQTRSECVRYLIIVGLKFLENGPEGIKTHKIRKIHKVVIT